MTISSISRLPLKNRACIEKRFRSENKLLVNHMGRAFSPYSNCVYQFPGALPQAVMEQAFGPPI
jgi:hypothetical protein